MKKMIRCFFLYLLIARSGAIPIDNAVLGEPEIECESGRIVVMFNTKDTFIGRVYVKGLSSHEECVEKGEGKYYGGIRLPFNSCNVRRNRSLNPRGIFVSSTLIVSFHPRFETKVDRAYLIRCYYMESDKTVSSDFQVSMLTTDQAVLNLPMPVCRYEILDGGVGGKSVEFAIVGQQVFHKWTCDTESIDTYCMVVHSCTVDDSEGDKVVLVGPEGCGRDRHLLSHPQYSSDLMAGVEAHIFKYADSAQVFFQCQIAIYVKELGEDCPRPKCTGFTEGIVPNPQVSANLYEPSPLIPGGPYFRNKPQQHTRQPPRPPPSRFGYRAAVEKSETEEAYLPINRSEHNSPESSAERAQANLMGGTDGTDEEQSEIPRAVPKSIRLPEETDLWPTGTDSDIYGYPFRSKRGIHEFAGITDVEAQVTAVTFDDQKNGIDDSNLAMIIADKRDLQSFDGEEEFCLPRRLLLNALIGIGLLFSFLSGITVTIFCRKKQKSRTVLRLKS